MHTDSTSSQRTILQICHCYYDPFLDCARQYAVLFKDSRFKVVTVFLSGDADAEVADKAASDEVIFLEYQSKQLSGLKLGIIRKIRELNQQYNFAAVIAHRAKPTYVALMATDLPIFSIQHSFGNFDRFSRRLMVNSFKSRLTLLAVSNAVRDEIRDRLPGWPENKIETLYNRIDVDKVQAELLDRQQARQQLGLPETAWIVGSVGRLHPDKDPQTLVKAFAKALPLLPKGALLTLLGKGKLENELKQLIQQLDVADNVLMLGNIPEARRYFRAFDLFALSSDHEPFGMVLLEAMAAEVPIVTTDCGGGAEVVAGLGQLFPLGDEAALAQQFIAAAHTPIDPQSDTAQTRLNQLFSDEAARQCFWYLPTVQSMLH
ncbi:MAG: glycosyltransferase [Methylophaga sp.]|nr:glycosyltransferase [Methylophaga sp.]